MVAEVKEKVSNLIENRGGRQVIDSQSAIKYLTANLGSDLASVICSIEETEFKTYGRKTNPKSPPPLKAHNIAAAYVIVEILSSVLPAAAVQDWLTSYSEYLYGIPAVEMHRRPEDVRRAALNRITGGEASDVATSW